MFIFSIHVQYCSHIDIENDTSHLKLTHDKLVLRKTSAVRSTEIKTASKSSVDWNPSRSKSWRNWRTTKCHFHRTRWFLSLCYPPSPWGEVSPPYWHPVDPPRTPGHPGGGHGRLTCGLRRPWDGGFREGLKCENLVQCVSLSLCLSTPTICHPHAPQPTQRQERNLHKCRSQWLTLHLDVCVLHLEYRYNMFWTF